MKVLLVDAFNLIRRVYEARRDDDLATLTTQVSQSLQKALRRHTPSHAVVVFEYHDRTWRHLLYPQYKESRAPTPSILLQGVAQFQTAFKAIGVGSFALESYEADDVISTFATGIAQAENQSIILSTDKLYLQLLSDKVHVFNHFEQTELTAEWVMDRYGVRVDQLIDYWAMVGDSSNDVRGVPGIGAKSAAALLSEYGSLDLILGAEPTADRRLQKVQQSASLVRRCRQLVTLKCDVELNTNLRTYRLD